MKLVVGLGNVGREYSGTRHNAGFIVVDQLAKKHDASWDHQPRFFAYTTTLLVGTHKVMLAKPDTLMNRSGKAVVALKSFFKLATEDIVVVSDDLDLAFGKIRVRTGGSSGGQNGLKSIIESIGADFVRLRVGVAGQERPHKDASNYVLSPFSDYENKHLPGVISKAIESLEEIITKGPKHLSHTILED